MADQEKRIAGCAGTMAQPACGREGHLGRISLQFQQDRAKLVLNGGLFRDPEGIFNTLRVHQQEPVRRNAEQAREARRIGQPRLEKEVGKADP